MDKKILGCRIVDMDYFLKKVMYLQVQHSKRCTGGILEIQKEKREGLKGTLLFECNMCNKVITLCNEEPNKDSRSTLNRAAVWGCIATGSTYSHMQEFFSILDIPPPSKYMFHTVQRELSEVWKKSLWENMEQAGKEEHRAR